MKGGFTLIELTIVIVIAVLLTSGAITAFRSFENKSILGREAETVAQILKTGRNKTIASEGKDKWGVYFSTSSFPHRFILFKGPSYALRDGAFDEQKQLSPLLEIFEINLQNSASEIVFERISGETFNSGRLGLRLTNDPQKTETINIASSGKIAKGDELNSTTTLPSLKDSRHTLINYSRVINTSVEKIIMDFIYDSSVLTKEIVIADNIKNGQIDWEGEINVNGANQKIKIHTLRLNDLASGTKFSLHRDRRYNDKALKIKLSGDGSGSLIEYSADGLTTTKTSIYAEQPLWQ